MKKLAIALGIGTIILLLAIKLIGLLTSPRIVRKIDADALLAEYLCAPVPPGIVVVGSSGSISFASTDVLLEISVRDTSVFDSITKNGGFHPLEDTQLADAKDLFRDKLTHIDCIYGKFKKGSIEIIYLAVDSRNLRCYLYYGGG